MLNFLQNRTDQVPFRASGIIRKPSKAFGISVQSPSEFSNQHTMIDPGSYVNPHLRYEEMRKSKMSDRQKSQAAADWLRKANINLIEQDSGIVTMRPEEQSLTPFHQNFKKELRRDSSRFRMTKGEFTSFVETHAKNEGFGPIEGAERTLQKARETRKSIRRQSISQLQKFKSIASHSSIFKASSLPRKKEGLRRSRQQLHSSFQNDIESRRYRRSPDFQLPRVIRKPYITERSTKKVLQESSFNTIDLSRLGAYRY